MLTHRVHRVKLVLPGLSCRSFSLVAMQDVIAKVVFNLYLAKEQFKGHFIVCYRGVEWGKSPTKVTLAISDSGELLLLSPWRAERHQGKRAQAKENDGKY